jgi:hypothetical protein
MRQLYPARKQSRWKPKRKPLGSVYTAGGGLIGHFGARHVWGRYGGELGGYVANEVFDSNGVRIGVIKERALIHDARGPVAYCRDGDFIFPGGDPAGRYTGDETGAAAAFLLHLHRKPLRDTE